MRAKVARPRAFWLSAESGEPQERLGHPDFFLASANELVARRKRKVRFFGPSIDTILAAAMAIVEVVVHARETYVFAGHALKDIPADPHLDLGLRLDGAGLGGRLQPSTMQETMKF